MKRLGKFNWVCVGFSTVKKSSAEVQMARDMLAVGR